MCIRDRLGATERRRRIADLPSVQTHHRRAVGTPAARRDREWAPEPGCRPESAGRAAGQRHRPRQAGPTRPAECALAVTMVAKALVVLACLLYTSPSPRDR